MLTLLLELTFVFASRFQVLSRSRYAESTAYGSQVGDKRSCNDSIMLQRAFLITASTSLIVALTLWSGGMPASAATERILWSFTGSPDGAFPQAGLTIGAGGSFLGTTEYGGATGTLCPNGCGSVFEISLNRNGAGSESVLHSFDNQWLGAFPNCELILDRAGDIFGTTPTGRLEGDVFELKRASAWQYLVVHSFLGVDGVSPWAGLVSDAKGGLYGVTAGGGRALQGVAFEVPPIPGIQSARILHTFAGADGDGPYTPMIFDPAGNLFGSTNYGGNQSCGGGCGVVFELTLGKFGWTETVIHRFSGNDGAAPGMLVRDRRGDIFGSTVGGGTARGCVPGCGTIFELTQTAPGMWNHAVIHAFTGSDGFAPRGNLVLDASGNLYGTSSNGGGPGQCSQQGGCGVAFELSPSAGGQWKYQKLHAFGSGTDGQFPNGVIRDPQGNLYGTTLGGGIANVGTVFEISPQAPSQCSAGVRCGPLPSIWKKVDRPLRVRVERREPQRRATLARSAIP
jgi:uncharacterized repeat protein (TIGR03803 family)